VTPLLYFVVAVIAASLATRAFLADQDDSARRAYLGLGWSVAIAYAAFSLSLLPLLQGLRVIYMLAGCFVPAMALWTFDRIFDDQVSRTPARLVLLITTITTPLLTLGHVVFFYETPRASPPEVVAGVIGFVSFGLAIARLWQAHETSTLAVEKVRLRYLVGVTSAAVLLTLAEHLARNLGPPVDPTGLSLGARVVALQGALPPFSAIFTGIALYLLHHTLVLSRLLDLQELFSRMAALLLSAALLVLIDGLTFLWVDAFSTYPFHSAFQIFLASLMFLAAYEPMRPYIAWASNRLFNQRGQRLQDTLSNLAQTLPTVISKEGLAEVLGAKLHASGRVPVCSVYLWDGRTGAFTCAAHRGHGDQRPLAVVASGPFTEQLASDTPWHARATVRRKARQDERTAEVLSVMDAMKADLVMPFLKSGVVLGWIALRDEDWSDGYSADEILKLEEIADLGTVVLSNIRDFQQLQEKDRLAALGAMAAGLAHEIRNPLAGVKGAAQYLQSEALDDDANEMLGVIIDEANRLDVVVRQFLDYARPFELDLQPEHLNAIVTHVVTLTRASKLPESIDLRVELAGDLPRMQLDGTRLSQVLLNLLQNAIQAMPDGGRVTVETRRTRDRFNASVAEVVIRDTGHGIEEGAMEQLFIPFFTTKETGTGLGLPICQRIVRAHGGDLDVQSVIDMGATFIVRLPLPAVPEERPEPDVEPEPAAEEAAK
jgi:signal transduction histidine kinase